MNYINFEWDVSKASANKRKHGTSFDEAKTVFYDEHAVVIHDPEHSDDEVHIPLESIGNSTLNRSVIGLKWNR